MLILLFLIVWKSDYASSGASLSLDLQEIAESNIVIGVVNYCEHHFPF